MSKWIYRKPEPTHIRGSCILCPNLQKKTSEGTYQALCSGCDNKRFGCKKRTVFIKRGYGKYKKKICSECSFVAVDRCQLDVHHKDGNHHNNDPNNLETLCANCHRLKHKKNPLDNF